MLILSSSIYSANDIIVDETQKEKDIIPFKVTYKVTEFTPSVSPLSITSDDVLWEFSKDGTYVDLIIRKKRNIKSVLLTNMYYGENYIKEYGQKAYGLRARSANSINGNELRVVNNKVVGKKMSLYFLVDSTPEANRVFGLAYRIRIPRVVEYGYKTPGENFGIISIEKGVTLNLRTYVRKYADHRGKFQNNPIHIDFTEKDYYERIKPTVTKIKEYIEADYKVVMIQYYSRLDYIKYFLVRDYHIGKTFQRVSFTTGKNRKHKTAVVLRAIRKEGDGIHITALIYFKNNTAEKDYDIAAIDQQNRVSKNYVTVTIQQKGKLNDKTLYRKEEIKIPDSAILNNTGDETNFFGE